MKVQNYEGKMTILVFAKSPSLSKSFAPALSLLRPRTFALNLNEQRNKVNVCFVVVVVDKNDIKGTMK